MNAEWNENTVPSLTLEPDLNETPELVVAEEPSLQQPKAAEPVLTAEEQKIVDDFLRLL